MKQIKYLFAGLFAILAFALCFAGTTAPPYGQRFSEKAIAPDVITTDLFLAALCGVDASQFACDAFKYDDQEAAAFGPSTIYQSKVSGHARMCIGGVHGAHLIGKPSVHYDQRT